MPRPTEVYRRKIMGADGIEKVMVSNKPGAAAKVFIALMEAQVRTSPGAIFL